MSDPGAVHAADESSTPRRAKIRPATVLPVIIVLILFAQLVAPREEKDTGFQLTTHSTGQFGAQGLYEILGALGWRTSRTNIPFRDGLDSNAVYAILAPPQPLAGAEDSVLVRFVRRGGRLFLVYPDSTLTSQFGMWMSFDPSSAGARDGVDSLSVAGDSAGVIHRTTDHIPFLVTQQNMPFSTGSVVRVIPPVTDTLAIFLWRSGARADSATAPPIMVGRTVGLGKVVLMADPMMLSNDAAREGKPALAMHRAIEWLDPPNKRVIFDEYHHGYGLRENKPFDVLVRALTRTAPGHVALQVVAAALILLIAIGVRPILPHATTGFQRRSPLEHVDALARAYRQIHATRLGAQRLVRGLRRRHPMGTGVQGKHGDTTYLEAIRARYGTDPDDMTAIRAALQSSVSDDAFLHAGQAVGRIEHSITTQ
jgi:hypothetical protein